ncbi:hypothetical protein [Spirosoma arcticum]
MEKLIISLALMLLSPGTIWAQAPAIDETVSITRVKKGEEPQAVMDALRKDFPNTIVSEVAFLPGALYGKEWAIQDNDDTDGDKSDLQYYQVSAAGPNLKYTAVYDKSGKLLSYKETVRQADLPGPVAKTINSQFTDWRVVGDRERITFSKNKTVVYRVKLAKGKEHERIYLDGNGRILRGGRRH